MGNTENADQKQEIMTGKEYRSISVSYTHLM